MVATLTLSPDTRVTAGILLLTVIAVEYGGFVVLRMTRGLQPATEFFLSSAGRGATVPNRLLVLLYAGIVALRVGVVTLGIGLLTA